MVRSNFSRWTMTFFALAAVLLAGCSTGFLQDAARTSLASFATDAFSAAVNGALNP